MSKPLQDFSDSRYERPGRTRVVHAATDSGRAVKEHSLRRKRMIFTVAMTAFITGATLLLFQSPYRNEFLAPGPLHSSHAQILAGQGADRCAACHGAATESFSTWFADAVSGGRKIGACQSDLCMECHRNSLNADYAMLAHNVSPADLAAGTEKAKAAGDLSRVAFLTSPPQNQLGEIACSACHREHHGGESLADLTDTQCQVCHSSNFHDFENGHPEFTSWPVQRRSRIAFDHSTHGLKHFEASGAVFDCSQCHIDDARQNAKLLAPFEQSCAACHDQEIQQSSEQTLPLVSLPMLDLDAARQAGADVGIWPESATGDFDGPVPGIMRMLLYADKEAAELLTRYGDDFEFGDIDPFEPDQVRDAVRLAWSIKRLMHELAHEGNAAVHRRLEIALGRTVPEETVDALMNGIDQPVFRYAVDLWLPNLDQEMQSALASGRIRRLPEYSLASIADGKVFFSMRSAPRDEWLAENPLKTRMQSAAPNPPVSAQPPNQPTPGALPPVSAPPRESAGGSGLAQNGLVQTRPPVPASGSFVNQDESGADFLANNPLKTRVQPGRAGSLPAAGQGSSPAQSQIAQRPEAGQQQPSQSPRSGNSQINLDESGDEFLAANPLKQNPGLISQAAPNAHPPVDPGSSVRPQDTEPPQQPIAAVPPPMNSQTPATSAFGDVPVSTGISGWVRNDNLLQIGYRPTGHADRTLARWTRLVVETAHGDQRFETSTLFRQLTNPDGIGMCRRCHTVDQQGDAFSINWKSGTNNSAVRGFTKFTHGPHLVQPHLQDCSYCHQLDSEVSMATVFDGFDATATLSNFKAIRKSNCSSCHAEGKTDDRCTHCHNYHVGSRITGDE